MIEISKEITIRKSGKEHFDSVYIYDKLSDQEIEITMKELRVICERTKITHSLEKENRQLRELLEELFYGLEWTLDEQNVELMRKVEKELADV